MQYEVEVDGRVRQVSVRKEDNRFVVAVDDRERVVDAARIDQFTWSLIIDGVSREVTVVPKGPGHLDVRMGAAVVSVTVNGARRGVPAGGTTQAGVQRLVAPMPGRVVRVLVQRGDRVAARQAIVVVEAMKMENELRAGCDGVVSDVHVASGQSVEVGTLMAVIAQE